MSEKCTTIILPDSEWPGLLERSEESVEDMLRLAKEHAEYNIKQYQQVLDAKQDREVVRTSSNPIEAAHFATLNDSCSS